MRLRLLGRQPKLLNLPSEQLPIFRIADSFGSLVYKNLNYVTHLQMYPVPSPSSQASRLAKYLSNVNPNYFFSQSKLS